jgi:phosphoglycerate dehydrogenase-like enzyme
VLERLPNLKLLVTTGMRNKSIDTRAANDSGITVCGTGSQPTGTAELTWALILAVTRHIPQEDAAVRAGGWQQTIGGDLAGARLGVVGLGRLGTKVAKVGQAFGMETIAWSQNLTAEKAAEHGVTAVAKDELFARSDVLSVHLVLSSRSKGLIGAAELAAMKPTALLVNTSRGPIVDDVALVDALRRKQIRAAAVDVFDHEPLATDHPLRDLDNAIVTPHIGYVTRELYETFYTDAVEDIAAFRAGRPIRLMQ